MPIHKKLKVRSRKKNDFLPLKKLSVCKYVEKFLKNIVDSAI